LEATNTDIAIRTYPISQTPFFKRKTSAFLKIVKIADHIATAKSWHRQRILITSCRQV